MSFASGDAFPYPVNNEQTAVTNEYVVSPAVPSGAIRVVVRWTKKEADAGHGYTGGLYSGQPFDLAGEVGTSEGSHVTISDFVGTPQYDYTCSGMSLVGSYWTPSANGTSTCRPLQDEGMPAGYVFAHREANVQQTYVSSFTVDTSMFGGSRTEPIAFYVENFGASEIFSSQNSNLRVDVYTYRSGQVASSVYAPTQTFEIKNAQKSTNTQATSWHVFNITPDNGQGNIVIPAGGTPWKIQPVQSVKTSRCYVEKSMYPDVQCEPPSSVTP
jgi:hypothetical protein